MSEDDASMSLYIWHGCTKRNDCYRDAGHTGKCGIVSNQTKAPVAREKNTFSLESFKKKCTISNGGYGTCLQQLFITNPCFVCRAVNEINSLRATIRRYRMMAKRCGDIAYMAEHPEELESDHEPF